MTHGHNMLLGYKSKMLWLWPRVLSAPLSEGKVNAFTLLSLSVALCEKLLYSLFVDSTEVAGAEAQSRFHHVSPVCINVQDLSLADRFFANRQQQECCFSSSAVLTFTGTSKTESSV